VHGGDDHGTMVFEATHGLVPLPPCHGQSSKAANAAKAERPGQKHSPPPCDRLLLSHLLLHCVDTLLQVLYMLGVEV